MAGKKRDQHADDEAPVLVVLEHAEKQLPQPREIDRQQRQDRAELDQHREGLAEILVVEAEEMLDQKQMPGRGHRNELGQAFDDAEEDRLDRVQCVTCKVITSKLMPSSAAGTGASRAGKGTCITFASELLTQG